MKETLDIEIPGDDDENVGDGVPKKKKEKRGKTKEEKRAERKVVGLTLLFMVLVTLVFWLWPIIREGKWKSFQIKLTKPTVTMPKPEWKNYIEYKL